MNEQIRTWLSRYLNHEISIGDFQSWFMPVSWTSDPADTPTQELVDRIELRLAESSSGYWSETELRDELRRIVENQSFEIELNATPRIKQLFTSASARPSRLQIFGTIPGEAIHP
jgi:hypothetical protein